MDEPTQVPAPSPTATPQPPVAVDPPGSAPSSRPLFGGCLWPISLLLIVITLCGTYLLVLAARTTQQVATSVTQAPARVADALANAFRPNVQVNTVIHNTLTELHTTPKFVVLTPEFEVMLRKSSETTLLRGYVNLGTTMVTLRAPGNKVQYYVPLDRITREDIRFDPKRNALVITIPRPVLDEQVVDVQSDPTKILIETDNGWAKLDRYSGAKLREDAKRELRSSVVRYGRSEQFAAEARERAREEVRKLFAPLAATLDEGVALEIELEEPVP